MGRKSFARQGFSTTCKFSCKVKEHISVSKKCKIQSFATVSLFIHHTCCKIVNDSHRYSVTLPDKCLASGENGFVCCSQIHLIVAVPKYYDLSVTEEVTVEMMVVSGGKKSEPQTFTYLPLPTKKGMYCGKHQAVTLSCLTSFVLAHSREGTGWSSC